MFKIFKEEREAIYMSIKENLSICEINEGFSSIRRLEIRFLPLDPLLVSEIFDALRLNVVM